MCVRVVHLIYTLKLLPMHCSPANKVSLQVTLLNW